MREIDVFNTVRLIEPGPVLLVTTQGPDGPNVMTMGFHMMMQHEPPSIGCIIGPWDHSSRALRDSGECVLSVPRAEMARTVVDIGNCSGTEVDKFAAFELCTKLARSVAAPLLADCIANIECKIKDDALADRYALHILEAVRLWVAPDWEDLPTLHHIGNGCFREDGRRLDDADGMTKWRQLAPR
jgi:flavin reductase (DIM6/NTAB) family NADH-FMN oxidoreductase RutF